MKTHFWLGKFESEADLEKYFEEYYSEVDDDSPISKFAEDQGVVFYDHDFLETGFAPEGNTLKEKFSEYSYTEHWMEKLEKKLGNEKYKPINTLVMYSSDEIEKPVSSAEENYYLDYFGTIEYEI